MELTDEQMELVSLANLCKRLRSTRMGASRLEVLVLVKLSESLTRQEIGEQMQLHPPTANRVVSYLYDMGYLESTITRPCRYSLNELGEEILDRLKP